MLYTRLRALYKYLRQLHLQPTTPNRVQWQRHVSRSTQEKRDNTHKHETHKREGAVAVDTRGHGLWLAQQQWPGARWLL